MKIAPLLWLMLAAVSGVVQAAPGSWAASAQAVAVAVPGRFHWSQAMVPPDSDVAQNGSISTVVWRYQVAGGRQVRAWLCAGTDHCVPLPGGRGQTRAFEGTPATVPLQLRYALPEGERQALVVTGIQLVVNHQ